MKCDKICLMIPTYKRIGQLGELLESALKQADDVSRIRFCLCINESDILTVDYLNSRYWPNELHWEIIFENTREPNLSYYFNLMYDTTRFNDKGTLASMLGDDMVFKTKGYDTSILQRINENDGQALVFLNDNYIAEDRLCVNLFAPREVVDATKRPFMCPLFHADMIDSVWMAVGQMTGIMSYLNNVVLKHNHATAQSSNPEEWDETFQRLRPLQVLANSEQRQRLGIAYATRVAATLIEGGIGGWNLLAAPQK